MALGFLSLRHGVVQKFRCKMGDHHRDGDNVRRVDKKWRSVCTGCGASMIKVGDEWMLRSDFLARDDLSGNAHYSNL